jgi:hypothetical protein
MISLNGFSTFPILTESDLFMKSVQQKRHVGDSKRTDGLLFRATALRTIGSYDKDGDIDMEDSTTSAEGSPKGECCFSIASIVFNISPVVAGTQMERRKSGEVFL